MLVRFLAVELWLVALVCLGLQVVEWIRVRTATAESPDDKYFIASAMHWLLAAMVLGLLGVLVHAGNRATGAMDAGDGRAGRRKTFRPFICFGRPGRPHGFSN